MSKENIAGSQPLAFEGPEPQRSIAVQAFSIVALGFNGWIMSPGAREDVEMDFIALQQGREHPRVDPVEWRRNLAAMRIMQTIVSGIDQLQSPLFLPEIAAAEDLYKHTDEVIGQVGLNRMPSFDVQTLGPPVRCFLKDITPETKVESVVQQARINRGSVERQMTTISEMAEAKRNAPEEETLVDVQVLPNGMLAEVHRFPSGPTRTVDVPFYQQYVGPAGWAEDYLEAFLEDSKWVHDQF